MNASIGLISICGRLASRPAAIFASVASATRSSHRSVCCGSSARDFTVRMPCNVSTITLDFAVSASMNRFTRRLMGFMKATMMPEIAPAASSTIQDSTGCR